jgi:hypothetical protein
MATKRKSSKKSKKSKSTARRKATPTKAVRRPKKVAKKKTAPKSATKKSATKKKGSGKKRTKTSDRSSPVAFSRDDRGSRSGEQSGDLQGLSDREGADSESVDELIEEGNAFEADAVAGVESADDADEKEVRTHEVPEDDVPGEYLDED